MINIIDKTMYLDGLVTADSFARALDNISKESRRWIKPVARPFLNKQGIIDPISAGEYLRTCIPVVEKQLIEFAHEFSSVQWLWYLRRMPEFVFEGELPTTVAYDFALAETLSSCSRKREAWSASQQTLIFPITQTAIDHALQFCLGVRYLSRIHAYLRWAGKGVEFRFKSNDLPQPLPSNEVKSAVRLYDERGARAGATRYGNLPFGHSGTILVETGPNEPTVCGVVRVAKPATMPSIWQLVKKIPDPLIVLQRFIPYVIRLGRLVELNQAIQPFSIKWLSPEVGAILVLLQLVVHLSGTEPGSSISVPQYGYSFHLRDKFITNRDSIIKQVSDSLSSALPEVNFPQTAAELIQRLEGCNLSTWPLNPGPIIRGNKEWFLLDYASATTQLGCRLEFPAIQGQPANQRSRHFEDSIQSLIDQSEWKPTPELAKLRQRELKRDEGTEERSITDIDAIGCRNQELLIVSCKAEIYSAEYDIGNYAIVRNVAARIDQAVTKWQQVKDELLQHPVGRNYNFSNYKKIVAVVCTPKTVYTATTTSLESETNGLRRAVAAYELFDWLHGNV